MRASMLRKGVSAALVAVVAISALAVLAPIIGGAGLAIPAYASQPTKPATQGQGAGNSSANTTQNHRVKAVEALIKRVECLINRTLTLAKEYGVKLPSKALTMISRAEDLLKNATALAAEHPRAAFRLALRAAALVVPVYVHVVKALPPKVRKEIMAVRAKQAINMTKAMLQRLEKLLTWLKERVGTVPQPAQAGIARAEAALARAEELLKNGSVASAFRELGLARHNLAQTLMMLRREAGATWWFAAAADLALREVVMGTVRLANAMNQTVKLILSNRTGEAAELLKRIHWMAAFLLFRIRIIEGRAAPLVTKLVRRGFKGVENLTQVLKLASKILGVVSNSSLKAAEYLKEGKQAEALQELNATVATIKPVLQNLLKVARWGRGLLFRIEWVVGRVGFYIHLMIARHFRWHGHGHRWLPPITPFLRVQGIGKALTLIKARLDAAVKAFKSGKLSCTAFKRVLEGTQHVLKALLKFVQEHIPKQARAKLVKEITALLNYVTKLESSTTCPASGG